VLLLITLTLLLSKPEQHVVLRACAGRVTRFAADGDERRAWVIQSFQDYFAAVGARPTANRWEPWRKTEAGRGAPSLMQIRHLFGSWSAALAATPGMPAPDPTVARLIRGADRRSDDDCLEGLRLCVTRTGRLDILGYNPFAREMIASDPDFRGPANAETIRRRFGTWEAALNAAGFMSLRQSGDTYETRRRPKFRVGTVRKLLGEVFAEHGGPLTMKRYDDLIRERIRAGEDSSGDEPYPLSYTIASMFGTWTKALAECLPEALDGPRRAAAYSDEALMLAYETCEADIGHAPRQREYDNWRRDAMRADPHREIPSAWTLAMRLGQDSWLNVGAEISRRRQGDDS
jgi:hypothetical protein